MLRALVILLLLANLGFLAYTQGWLDEIIGAEPDSAQREPHRLARQVSPEKIRLLSPKAASAALAEAAASAASVPASGN